MGITVERRQVAAEECLEIAMLCSDVRALGQLLALGLGVTSHRGRGIDKAAYIASHRSAVLHLSQLEPSGQQVAVHGEVGIVCVRMQLTGALGGRPLAEAIRYTRVWSLVPAGNPCRRWSVQRSAPVFYLLLP